MLLALLLKTLLWDPKTINANPPKPIPAYQTWLFWLGVAVLIMLALTLVPGGSELSLTTVWCPVLLPELYILKHLLMGGNGGGYSGYNGTYSTSSPFYTPSASTVSASSPDFSGVSSFSPIKTLGGFGSAVSPMKPIMTLGNSGGMSV